MQVGDFLRASDGAGKSSRLDFPTFVKTYAWIFFRRGQNGADYSDEHDSSSDSGVSLIEGDPRGSAKTTQGRGSHLRSQGNHLEGQASAQRIGYGSSSSWHRAGKAGRRRSRMENQRVGMGIGEEAELRRWEKRLGEAQMRRLKQAFGSWADDASVLEVQDLGACFRELGKNADKRELRAWCEEADLAPEDVLSLADFAYAFHAMFGDVEEGARVTCPGKTLPPQRLYQGKGKNTFKLEDNFPKRENLKLRVLVRLFTSKKGLAKLALKRKRRD